MRARFRLTLMLVLASGIARAGEPDTSESIETLLQKGTAARSQGHDEEALQYFERADAQKRSPTTRGQIALAEQALGMWVRAERHLLEALSDANDPWVQKHRAALDGALVTIRQHVGTLELRGVAEGVVASVLVDGALVGTTPLSTGVRLESGKRQLEIKAEGYVPLTRTVWIPEGGVARETVTLVVKPADNRAPNDGGPTAQAGPPPKNTGRVLGIVSIAVGAAAAGFGGVSLALRQSAADTYNANCPGLGPGVVQSADCQSHIDSEGLMKGLAIGAFIGAGVLVTTGIVLVVTAPSSKRATSAARPSWILCGAGALCPVEF